MLHPHRYSHRPFLIQELKQFLPEGSFASYLWRTIGAELQYRLVDWPFEDESEYSSLFPIECLFLWVSEGWMLDPEWLASEDGSYLDDAGKEIPATVERSYSGIEQLAAYGLWLISAEIDCLGPAVEQGTSVAWWVGYSVPRQPQPAHGFGGKSVAL